MGVDPVYVSTQDEKTFRSRWKQNKTAIVIKSAAYITAFVCTLNIVAFIYGMVKGDIHGSFTLRTLVKGDCDKTDHINNVLHIFINTFSTILLLLSTFAMQVLTAPSRQDIDRAHQNNRTLDVGILSLKNIRSLPARRKWLLTVLALSSLPLHLLYNSVVFTSVAHNDYSTLFVYDTFLHSTPPYNAAKAFNLTSNVNKKLDQDLHLIAQAAQNWTKMDLKECWKEYAYNYIGVYNNLLLVADTEQFNATDYGNNSVTFNGFIGAYKEREYQRKEASARQCPFWAQCRDGTIIGGWPDDHNGSFEHVHGGEVYASYCIAQPVPGRCAVVFSPLLLLVIILFNIFKVVVLFIMAGKNFSRSHVAILTVGDAIETFLRVPGRNVRGLCVASEKDFVKRSRKKERQLLVHPRGATTWAQRRIDLHYPGSRIVLESRKRRRWLQHATRMRLRFIIPLFILLVAVAGFCIFYLLINSGNGSFATSGVRNYGLGHYSTAYSIDPHLSDLATSILANVPQVALSTFFLTYNVKLTRMLANHEFNMFSINRQGLRVTQPSPGTAQRSTYRLQIPYTYAIINMVLQYASHFFVPESVFSVLIREYDDRFPELSGGYDAYFYGISRSSSVIGYSNLASIIVIALCLTSLIFLFGNGLRKYAGIMPIGGTCSASIAAACWRPGGDMNAFVEPVMWGQVRNVGVEGFEVFDDGGVGKVPHLCLTSWDVVPAEDGVEYH